MDFSIRSSFRIVCRLLALAIAFFLLLETSARVFLFGWAGLVPARVNSVHGLPQTGYTQPSALPGVPFEFKPNLDGYFKLVPFRTNSRGFRDREYDVAKPPGTFRVAVVGSSFSLPAGVAIEDAFHSLLEVQLSEEKAPTRYEFINFSIGMLNANHMLALLEQRALAFSPDLILFCTTKLSERLLLSDKVDAPAPPGKLNERLSELENSLNRKKSYPALQSFFLRLVAERTRKEAEAPRFHVGLLERAFMGLMERVSAADAEAAPEASEVAASRRPVKGPRRATAKSGKEILQWLAWNGKQAGVPIVIIRLEFDQEISNASSVEVARMARALGLHHLDTRAGFRGTRARDFWIYELDPHPNAAAHEIFARAIAKFLRAEGLLPE